MNVSENRLSIRLSDPEVYVVLSYLGADSMPGFENAEEINQQSDEVRGAVLATAERSLVAREYLKPKEDSEDFELELLVMAMVGACAFPDLSVVILQQQMGQQPEVVYCHVSRKMVVMHGQPMAGVHSFIAFEDVGVLLESIRDIANLPEGLPAPFEFVLVEEDVLADIQSIFQQGNVEQLTQQLVAGGLSNEMAKAFTSDVVDRQSLLSFTQALGEGFSISEQLTVLVGNRYLWLLRPSDERNFHSLGTLTREEAHGMIKDLFAIPV